MLLWLSRGCVPTTSSLACAWIQTACVASCLLGRQAGRCRILSVPRERCFGQGIVHMCIEHALNEVCVSRTTDGRKRLVAE